MSRTRLVSLSAASTWTWAAAGAATALAAWHAWGITVTPERPYYWFITAADLLVAVVAATLAARWPRYARFTPDALVLSRKRIPYEEITALNIGTVSAKPFWLAFWLPQSLVVGLIVLARRAEVFDRQVVELSTPEGPVRARWRDTRRRVAFVDALRTRSDVEPTYGVDGSRLARDYTPRLSAGGGFLALGLVVWAFFAGLFGIQLLDRSTYSGPFPTAATSTALRGLTDKLSGYPTLAGVPVEFRTWPCSRTNNLFLGPSPDVVELHMRLVGPDVMPGTAEAVENRLREQIGLEAGLHVLWLDDPDTKIQVGIPASEGLYIEVSAGCTATEGHELLRADLQRLASALGAGR